jgi:hypothetical protein
MKNRRLAKPRQIIGFSLDPELASEVKAEADRRGLPLKVLFRELWALYKKQKKPKPDTD